MTRFDSEFAWWGFPWGWAGRGRRRRRGKWFEAGELKYVILRLLKDKPKHGYEIMKDLEDRCQGLYQPSPGAVYPTLQWLEDEGLVRSSDIDGKKVYQITAEGERFLEEHKDTVDEILDRVKETLERIMGGANPDVHKALGHLVGVVYRAAWKAPDDDVRRRIAERLTAVASEIEEVGAG